MTRRAREQQCFGSSALVALLVGSSVIACGGGNGGGGSATCSSGSAGLAEAGANDSGRSGAGGSTSGGTEAGGTNAGAGSDAGGTDAGGTNSGAGSDAGGAAGVADNGGEAGASAGSSNAGTGGVGGSATCAPTLADPTATVQDFKTFLGDACASPATAGTPFVCNQGTNDLELAGPRVYEGEALDPPRFVRLVSPPRPVAGLFDQNTLTFAPLAAARSVVVSDFDFRITPGPGLKRADGLGFALLNANAYPTGSVAPEAPCLSADEPAFRQSIGVGFDIYQNAFDLGNPDIRIAYSNSISVQYVPAGTVYATCDDSIQASSQVEVEAVGAAPQVLPLAPELAGSTWNHARIVVEQQPVGAAVSVRLTAEYGETATVADHVPVPVPVPYAPRVWLGARAGGENAYFDVANVRVHSLSTDESGVSFSKRTVLAAETAPYVELTVVREGNLTAATTVQFSTSDGSATAGQDYQATCGEVTFQPGETQKKVQVGLLDDTIDETFADSFPGTNDAVPVTDAESFTVALASNDPKTHIFGPAEAQVRIADDEGARINGSWGPLLPSGILAVHAALLPTGKILYLDRLGNAALWAPGAAPRSIVGPGYDAFCNGAAFLGDGRLLVAGGHGSMHGSAMQDGVGVRQTSAFNPTNETWQALPQMNAGRWYPSVITQSDGTALVISGSVDVVFTKNPLSQVFLPATNTYRNLDAAAAQPVNADALGIDLYPRIVALPNAVSVKVGPDPVTWILDTKAGGAWTQGPITEWTGDRIYGPIALRGHRVMLIGGGGDDVTPPTSSVEELNLDALTTGGAWAQRAPMAFRRRQHNATTLPDGRVLVTGGCQGLGFSNMDTAVTPAEMYDGSSWRVMPAATVPRGYHSFALLLPDGSVLTGGGGQGAALPSEQNNFQIYYPDYFYKTRPVIGGVPAEIAYDTPFTIETTATVSRVTVVRLAAVTHSFDENERFADLTPTPTAGGVKVAVPGDGWIPPGHYLVFVVDSNGIPSKGEIIHVS